MVIWSVMRSEIENLEVYKDPPKPCYVKQMSLTDKQKQHYEILRDINLKRSERLRRGRLSSSVVSVSNNSKWEKIFDVLQSEVDHDSKCLIKLLKQEEPWEYKNILSSVFEKTYFDGFSGPLSYSEIEWIELECNTSPVFNFALDIEKGEGFIVIYGYRVNNTINTDS